MTDKYMYFVANWKMFGGLKTLNSLNRVISFSNNIKKSRSKIIYCPPTTLILPVFQKFKKTSIEVGAQNCHESKKYASLTGQINSKMLKDVGAKYVILGHSENRQTGEDNKLINQKIKSSLISGLKVIFCIGETLKEKRKKITKKILNNQLKFGLNKVKSKNNIIIAYEPVWSIGTGLVPKNNDLYETINFIKKKISKIKVLYGGSVNPININNLKSIDNIDGYLIGGASQNSKKFIDIIKKRYS